MKISILHLSDIHIKGTTEEEFLEKVAPNLTNLTSYHASSSDVIFIAITGDIAFSGKEHEYLIASKFIEKLKNGINADTKKPVEIIIVPGNHDCNFSNANQARSILLQFLTSNSNSSLENDTINQIASIQDEYFKFEKDVNPNYIEHSKIFKTFDYIHVNTTVRFALINTSWCSELHEKQGKMIIPNNAINFGKINQNDIVITLFHHPFNWFSQSCYHDFRKNTREHSNFIVTGHEHQPTVTDTYEQNSGECVFIEGASLHDDYNNSEFSVINIDTDSHHYIISTYKYDPREQIYVANSECTNTYGCETKNKNGSLSYSFEILENNNDLGGAFQNSGTDHLKISDIYVYPHIKEIGNDVDNHLYDASELKKVDFIGECIILKGDEKTGKTTLLKTLLVEHLKNGLHPIYMDGKELKISKPNQLTRSIESAINTQYTKESAFDTYKQVPKEKRILFFDNFDEIQVKSTSGLDCILNELKSTFGNIVITVNEFFDLTSFINEHTVNPFNGYRNFSIQPFGFRKRNELIKRWYSVGSNKFEDESLLFNKVDKAEKNIGIIISKNLIPPAPIYLLTLMQSMEAGHGSELNESSLGEYYRFLITQSLLNNGIKRENLTEYFEYLCQLSWYVHQNTREQLTHEEIRNFNSIFSNERHTVELRTRLGELCAANILSNHGGFYSFKYPYIYYFFKGLYLSDNIELHVCVEHINHCFKHLYVRSNAHTILFLAHHAGSSSTRTLIECMKHAMSSLFRDNSPVTFETDEGLTNIVRHSPNLIYNKTSPEEHRQRVNETKDLADSDNDGLSEIEEDNPDDLSLVAQITTMFKAIEIAGQFLKNQYAKINRLEKREILNEIFSAPLRSLDNFYEFIRENPDALISEIEKKIERKGISNDKEKIRVASQQTVSALIQFLSVIYLTKPAQAANSANLFEDVFHIVDDKKTTSYKMIRLAQLLDSPSAIPRGHIEEILKESKNNIFVKKILQIIVIKRLYMYRTAEADMQWINSKLDIDITKQKEISYIKGSNLFLTKK
ncbi:STAND family AAA ATPase [Aeromonas caviae]|uniref:STAND family AAA ATPase n=1 Tax=Aeromonas caviae TaxID=648 RepID=UPI0038D02911